jgi:hypothetical protein
LKQDVRFPEEKHPSIFAQVIDTITLGWDLSLLYLIQYMQKRWLETKRVDRLSCCFSLLFFYVFRKP